MSSDQVEVLDASIVVLLKNPLAQIPQGKSLFEDDKLQRHMKSVTVSQALQLDPTSGNIGPMFAFESMRSQKTATVGASRIDAHDRSGKSQVEAEALAEIISGLVSLLGAEISNVGANFDITFSLPDEVNAAQRIEEVLFRQGKEYAPKGLRSIGATARLYFEETDVRYTIIIEPRLNSVETTELYMTSNANVATEEMLPVDRLIQLIQRNCAVVQELAHGLFGVSWSQS